MTLETLMVIRGKPDPIDLQPLFWSNQDGWVDLPTSEGYTKDEVKRYGLPLNGEWVDLRVAINEYVTWAEDKGRGLAEEEKR